MTWYAVYERRTGALVSVGDSVVNPLPAHLDVAEYPTQPAAGTTWDTTAHDFVALPAPTVPAIDPNAQATLEDL